MMVALPPSADTGTQNRRCDRIALFHWQLDLIPVLMNDIENSKHHRAVRAFPSYFTIMTDYTVAGVWSFNLMTNEQYH